MRLSDKELIQRMNAALDTTSGHCANAALGAAATFTVPAKGDFYRFSAVGGMAYVKIGTTGVTASATDFHFIVPESSTFVLPIDADLISYFGSAGRISIVHMNPRYDSDD